MSVASSGKRKSFAEMTGPERDERTSQLGNQRASTLGGSRKRMVPLDQVEMPPYGLTTQQRKEVERAFKTFDTDGSGNVDAFELKLAMRALGMKMSEEEIEVIMDEVDVDKSGEIDLDEFMEIVRPGIGGKDTLMDVKRCFYEYFDLSGDGQMSFDEFEGALPCFESEVTQREAETAYRIADKSGKGYIDEIDWIDLCASMNLGPQYSEYELAEVMMIRQSLEKQKQEQKEERWNLMQSRGPMDYEPIETINRRRGSIDVHDFVEGHQDPETFVPPPLPPSVERRAK